MKTEEFIRTYAGYLRDFWESMGFPDAAALLLDAGGNMQGMFTKMPTPQTVPAGQWIILKTGPLLKSTGAEFVKIEL